MEPDCDTSFSPPSVRIVRRCPLTCEGGRFRRVRYFRKATRCRFGDRKPKHSLSRPGLFQCDAAAMLLGNLVCQCQSQTDAARLAFANKRLKERDANRLRHTRPVIDNEQVDDFTAFDKMNMDSWDTFTMARGLAGVKKKIINGALNLQDIHPHFYLRHWIDDEDHVLCIWMCSYQCNRALCHKRQRFEGQLQRLAGAAEKQQRLNKIGHAAHTLAHFLEQFLALFPAERIIAKELCIGINRGEIMAQVMRNRAGHPSNRGQALGG